MAIDPLGLTILLIGLAFLVIELANPGYFLGVPGTTGVIVGLIQMAWPDFLFGATSNIFVSMALVVGVAVAALVISIEFYRRFAPAVKAPETLSSDGLVGKTGRVVSAVDPDSLKGKVKVGGIVWSATADSPVEAGAEVVVDKVDGVHLIVRRTGGGTHG